MCSILLHRSKWDRVYSIQFSFAAVTAELLAEGCGPWIICFRFSLFIFSVCGAVAAVAAIQLFLTRSSFDVRFHYHFTSDGIPIYALGGRAMPVWSMEWRHLHSFNLPEQTAATFTTATYRSLQMCDPRLIENVKFRFANEFGLSPARLHLNASSLESIQCDTCTARLQVARLHFHCRKSSRDMHTDAEAQCTGHSIDNEMNATQRV